MFDGKSSTGRERSDAEKAIIAAGQAAFLDGDPRVEKFWFVLCLDGQRRKEGPLAIW